jgi:transcriptional regulator with XRE-family HTH domain
MTVEANSACRNGGEPERLDSLRAFGAVLAAFRKRAGLTQEQLAPQLGYSVQTLASIEQGRRFPPADFVERAEDVLDAFGALRGAARHLSRKSGLASWFRQWAHLEAEAVTLYTYECRLVPGLLQTETYARTLFRNQLPPMTDDQVEAKLTARMDRKRLLYDRPNTAYSFILEEGVFLRGTGNDDITREALDHVLDVAELRNVELQIMPQQRRTHAGLDGPMRIVETPDHKWLGYCEGQESSQFLTDPEVISKLQMRYARMRSQAHTLEDSVSLLQRMRGEL